MAASRPAAIDLRAAGAALESGAAPLLEQLGPLDRAAVLLDFDGTVAPIVSDPAAAAPPAATRAAIEALAARAALVACVTGRPALQARGLLGIDAIAYSGLHGAERLEPGAGSPQTPAAFAGDAARVHAIVAAAAAEPAGLAGLSVEDKGPIVALHWRTAPDPQAAQARAAELARRATAAGLRTGEGRAVLELRPGLEITKGDAARALLAAAPAARRVLFAGDDVTDLDAFAALRELEREGRLERAVLVAVAGADAPPRVAAAADAVVASPHDLGRLLAVLAGGTG